MATEGPEDHDILQNLDGDSWGSKHKMAEIRPVPRNERGALNVLSYDETEYQTMSKPQNLYIEEDIELSKYKIALLKASDFKENNESDTITIMLNDSNVKLRTDTSEGIVSAKLKMYECLDKIIVKVKKLPALEYNFLSRSQCIHIFQSKCDTESLIVEYETDKKRQEIRCHSFSERDSDRGIQLLEEAVTRIIINLRSEHLLRLRDNEWPVLISTLDTDDTAVDVVQSESRVYIKSLKYSMATEAKRKITQYFGADKNVSTKVARVTLETSKARCFKMWMEDKLRQEVLKRNGKLEVTELRKTPMLLEVSVEGSEAVAIEMKKVIQQIWHESVDFSTISIAEADIWLIMKGLNGQQGKEFLTKFECNHNCFIEITQVGNTPVLRTRVTIEDVCDTADDDVLKAEALSRGPREDSDSYNGSTSDPTGNVDERFSQYQGNMTDTEAMDLAMSLSLQSSDKLVAVVDPQRHIDTDEESREIYSDEKDLTSSNREQQELTECWRSREVAEKRNYEPRHAQNGGKIRWLKLNNTDVKLVQGAVAKQKADALVNVVSASRGIAEGVVSQSFLEIGGEQLSKMYEGATSKTSGVIVVTGSSGQLRCDTVLHVLLQRSENCKEVVRKAVSNILEECRTWGCKTVAVPPIGVGRMFRFPSETVAASMLSEMSRQFQGMKYTIKRVTIVIHDKEVYNVFDKAFEEFQKRCDPFSREVFKGSVGTWIKEASSEPGGARSSSTSSSQLGDVYNRNKTTTYHTDRKEKDRGKGREKKRSSRYPDSKPVPKYKVQIVAQEKDICIEAMRAFGRKIAEKFLYEEVLPKRQKISAYAKQKIANIITANSITSIKCKDKYILRGHKKSVQKAYADVLKVLLTEKDNPDETKKRKAQTKRETKEFVEVMVKGELDVPCYWQNYKEGETLMSLLLSAKHFVTRTKYEKVALASNSREFSSIVKMVNSTFDPTLVGQGKDAAGLGDFEYQKLYILKVERIENLHLFEQFARKRQNFFMRLYKAGSVRFPKLEKIPKCSGCVETYQYVHPHLDKDIHPEINEHLLFHGTKKSYVKVICNDGLDPRLGNGDAMFGPGIYASEKATKADQYTDENNNRSAGQGNPKMMFLIRMLLGSTYLCTDDNPKKFRRPPCTRCYRDNCNNESHGRGKFGHTFDSVVGDNRKLFREFVVYDGSLCYPEYLITYERR